VGGTGVATITVAVQGVSPNKVKILGCNLHLISIDCHFVGMFYLNAWKVGNEGGDGLVIGLIANVPECEHERVLLVSVCNLECALVEEQTPQFVDAVHTAELVRQQEVRVCPIGVLQADVVDVVASFSRKCYCEQC